VEAPAAPGLPETPSRRDVMAALRGRGAAVRACASGDHGVVIAAVSFDSSGRATRVEVNDSLSASVERCVEDAIRAARVPAFRRPSFRVNYPYRI